MRAAFLAPFLAPATLRFLRAAIGVEQDGQRARVGLLTQEPIERIPADIRESLAACHRIADGLDPDQIVDGVRALAPQLGGVDCLMGILEQAMVPMAVARQRLGIPGVGPETADLFRDKSRMKQALAAAGVPCARHRLAGSPDEAVAFVREVGFPVVAKPPAGAGAIATHRVEDEQGLREVLALHKPTPDDPVLLEEFLQGEEFSFDSVVMNGELLWHSCSRYLPTPLDVLRNPWMQWCVILPSDIGGSPYSEAATVGAAALRTLGLETGFSHMEWFRTTDDRIAISEVGARPPGAQFSTLLSYAHGIDFYSAWARLEITGRFEPPRRQYACGAAFLRGQGVGRVVEVHGLEEAQREVGSVVVEAKLPEKGQPRSDGYEGDGYAIVRHPETEVVEQALAHIVKTVRVEVRS